LPNTNNGLQVIALIAVFTGTFAVSSGHFENPDAHLRLSQAFSLVNDGSFQLADGVGNIQHGNVAANIEGERFSVYNPGQIALFTPAVILSQRLPKSGILHPHYLAELISSFLGVAIHFFTGIGVFLAGRAIGRSRSESIVLGLVFSFCTFNLPSSRDGYEHVFEALFIILSYSFAWKADSNCKALDTDYQNKMYLTAGLLLGLGVIFRTTSILALPGLLLICSNWRSMSRVVGGIVPEKNTISNTSRE